MSFSADQPVKVACLGAGYFSQFHRRSWQRMETAVLAGVCDADMAKAEATGVAAYDELGTMLEAVKPHLLDIIVPPPGHAEAIRTALDYGVRWIICQKPFCQSLDEARAITRQAEDAGATVIVHENFRFQPWYRWIKLALEDRLIGDVLQMTFRLRPGDGQGERAYLDRQPYFQTMPRFLVHETAVHWIDTFRYLFGDAVAVYADLRQVNPVIAGEDAGHISFDHQNGVRTFFDGNRLLDHASDNTRRTMGEALIEGTTGTLDLLGDGSVGLRRFGQKERKVMLVANISDEFGGDCVHALQSHVIAGMLGEGAFENLASEYLKVIEVEGVIYESSKRRMKLELV
ncbi:MAG: Gfo/Idh/MocA family oxidoreductase [Pseudomonadota bacterium]